MLSSSAADLIAKDPWLKFFVADWQGDELLALCSYAARGFLLVELICLMHKSKQYGYLLVNGTRPSDIDLARLTRGPSVIEVRRLRAELLARGVLSTDDRGVIYSRRMVRAARRMATARGNGALGGNPALLKSDNHQDNRQDNHQDNRQVNLAKVKPSVNPEVKPYILDARSKKISRSRDPGTSTASVQTAASRRLKNSPGKHKAPTHRRLCAIAKRELRAHPGSAGHYGEWADLVKQRLAAQGFDYPTPHALTGALDAVSHAQVRR